jgi:hypothetical protein
VLALFDPDPARAAAHYEALRERLVRFFAWKSVRTPEECADETIDRVAQRLAGGEEIKAGEPARYFHGVARNVLREYWAREQREARHRALWPREALVQPPEAPAAQCLHRCLEALAPETRRLALEYYDGTGGERIASRRAMAARLGVPIAALRVRMHRPAGAPGGLHRALSRSRSGNVSRFPLTNGRGRRGWKWTGLTAGSAGTCWATSRPRRRSGSSSSTWRATRPWRSSKRLKTT